MAGDEPRAAKQRRVLSHIAARAQCPIAALTRALAALESDGGELQSEGALRRSFTGANSAHGAAETPYGTVVQTLSWETGFSLPYVNPFALLWYLCTVAPACANLLSTGEKSNACTGRSWSGPSGSAVPKMVGSPWLLYAARRSTKFQAAFQGWRVRCCSNSLGLALSTFKSRGCGAQLEQSMCTYARRLPASLPMKLPSRRSTTSREPAAPSRASVARTSSRGWMQADRAAICEGWGPPASMNATCTRTRASMR